MKRSEINRAVQRAVELLGQEGIGLPAFGYWKLEDWKQNSDRLEIIRQTMLGWDVTDFSSGDFLHTGSVLFTIRNGSPSGTGTPYAEKLIFQRHETEQEIPFHFHRIKTEDIINRGGGILCMRLWKADKETEMLTEEPLVVSIDGVSTRVAPGETVRLAPGQSICYEPYLYHTFWAEDDHCLVGEVSTVNDDMRDNRFLTPKGRFPQIEEDVPAEHLLCNEYPEV